MSAIALTDFERDVHAALDRVRRGESLLLVNGGQRIAQITPVDPPDAPSLEKSSLADFFLNSPLRGSGIEMTRDRSGERVTQEF